MPNENRYLGLDLGGTAVKAGLVADGVVIKNASVPLKPSGSLDETMAQILKLIDTLEPATASGIGVGAPSVVNVAEGIVYDTQNIPSWREVDVPLGPLLTERYRIPAYVNNDANCFVLGEKYFGKAKGYSNVVGVTIGTGLGSGLIRSSARCSYGTLCAKTADRPGSPANRLIFQGLHCLRCYPTMLPFERYCGVLRSFFVHRR